MFLKSLSNKSALLFITLNFVFTSSAFTEDKITGTWTNEKKGDNIIIHEYDYANPVEEDANTPRLELKVLSKNEHSGVGRFLFNKKRKQKHRIPVQRTPL
jgi:hypothetical protein